MKKILFVMNNLSSGGAEKSLSSLLSVIDFSKYEVDLLLFRNDGIYFQDLPSEINRIQEPLEYKYFDMSFKKAIKGSLLIGRFDVAISRIKVSAISRTEKNRAKCEQRAWTYIGSSIRNLDKEYDVAVGFMEKSSIYYIVEKVSAKKKIGWIHTNYNSSGMDPAIDSTYFFKLDHIVTVSEECAMSLKNTFPDLSNRVEVIQNIVSPEAIKLLANEELISTENFDKNAIKIATVGRLGHEKGIDLAIESCRLLVEKGYKINWKVIGYGTDKEIINLNKQINEKNLTGVFQLIGVKDNPYPYIKTSDFYIQPSRFEGKSIAIDEAKILDKPIIVTNFPTAKDQIIHNVNGLIAEMNPEAICNAVSLLIRKKDLRDKIVDGLSKEKVGTVSEIKKFHALCAN